MPSSICPPRTPCKLSDSLQQQLNRYALAAGAAAVSVLALGRSADAKVIYTPVHKWLPVNHDYYLDLNHDGMNDFKFTLSSNAWSTGFYRRLSVRAARSQSQNDPYLVNSGGLWCAAALPKGTKIGPNSPGFKFRWPAAYMFSVFSQQGTTAYFYRGPWMNIKGQAYLGVRFAIKGKVHYGWARIGNISHNKPAKALLTGYAYETVSNKAIAAGKTKGPASVATPQDTLGDLALGRK